MPAEVTLDDTVEDLVERHPDAVTFLMERGIRCIQCGEPSWGTLRDLIANAKIDPDSLLSDLRQFIRGM